MTTSSRPRPENALALIGLALVFAAQYLWVKPTNFGGFDEWLILSLNSRGIWSFPHANRPLQLIWTSPAVLLSPCDFRGYYALHGAYLLASGFLLWRIALRIFDGSPLLAFVAGVGCVAWAPLDMFRLDAVQASSYSGVLMGALLSLLLFVTSVERESVPRLTCAAVLAFLTMRSYEGVLGLLLGAPLLLPFSPGSRRWRGRASVSFEAVVALSLAIAARPFLARSADSLYQAGVLEADLHPVRYLHRLTLQFWLSLRPVVPDDWGVLGHSAVPLAAAAFVGCGVAMVRRTEGVALRPLRRLALAAGLGLLLAGLGYSVILVSARVWNATRTQILSAPGIALFFAAMIALLAALAPPRLRPAAVLTLGAWVVAVGTGQTIGAQRAWDQRSLYTAQVSSLRQLVAQAPRLEPGTLVVLIDDSGTWPMSFSFRHALALAYGDGVVGHVLGADQIFYALVARREGLASVPWPVLRSPWKTEPTLHAYDAVVVYRLTRARELIRFETWDHPRLPRLPEGARYEPAARSLAGQPSECTRRLLALAAP